MDNRQIVRSIYEDYLNKGNVGGLRDIIAPEYQGIYDTRGPDGFIQTIQRVRTAFPNIQWKIEDAIAEGDKVALRWTWTGTHSGPLGDMPPTGKTVHDSGIAIYELRDGKVVQSWVQTDRLGLMQQLGAAGPMNNSNMNKDSK